MSSYIIKLHCSGSISEFSNEIVGRVDDRISYSLLLLLANRKKRFD